MSLHLISLDMCSQAIMQHRSAADSVIAIASVYLAVFLTEARTF